MKCESCGCENEKNAKYCENCGLLLKGSNVKKGKNKKIGIAVACMILVLACSLSYMFVQKKEKTKEYHEELAKAEIYMEKADYKKAEATYLKVIEIDKKQVEPYLKLSDIYLEQNNLKKASDILKKGEENTKDEAVKKEQQLVDYIVDTEVKEQTGPITNIYETSYEKVNQFQFRVVPEEDAPIILAVRIRNFDADGQKELLVVNRKMEMSESDSHMYNFLYLQMYEVVDGKVILKDEYRMDTPFLGFGDSEDDGVFLKKKEDKIYICAGIYNLLYVGSDGSYFNSVVLTYQNGFQLYTGSETMMAGSNFQSDEVNAKKMADDLAAIGLTKDAQKIRESLMRRFWFLDEYDDQILRITGERLSKATGEPNDRTVENLGKIKYTLYLNPEDSVETSNENSMKVGKDKTTVLAELDQLNIECESIRNTTGSMAEMTRSVVQIREKWEDKMKEVYSLVYDSQDEKGKKKLEEEQNSWEIDSKKKAEEAGKEYEGGSLGKLDMGASLEKSYRERTYELANKLP